MDVKKLKERKKKLKLTTAQIAYMAELPVSTVSKIMTGETKNPSYITIEKIDKVLCHEEMLLRINAYRTALFEYMNAHPDENVDQIEFEKNYRKEHKLSNDPIPFAVPLDCKDLTHGNLALDNNYLSTVADLQIYGESRWIELLDGHIIINEAPLMKHQTIVQDLGEKISHYIKTHNGNCKVFNVGINVYPDEDDRTLLIPDIVVLCDQSKMSESGIMGGPDWVIEVVSQSTRGRDYKEKLHKYMASGVLEYWIIDPDKNRVTTYIAGEPMMAYIYSFDDQIPVQIYNGMLTIHLLDIYDPDEA